MIKGLLAAAVTILWSAADVRACAIQVRSPVQVMARGATSIAEAQALDTVRTFDVLRTFRGAPPPRIALGRGSNCDDPTAPGDRYLLFIHPDRTYVVASTEEALRFLLTPRRVTRRELVRTMETWAARRMTDEELAAWAADARHSADVDDWATIDGSSVSLTLHTIRMLDSYLDRRPCSIEHLRTRIVPRVLRLLRKRVVTERDVAPLEDDPCLH